MKIVRVRVIRKGDADIDMNTVLTKELLQDDKYLHEIRDFIKKKSGVSDTVEGKIIKGRAGKFSYKLHSYFLSYSLLFSIRPAWRTVVNLSIDGRYNTDGEKKLRTLIGNREPDFNKEVDFDVAGKKISDVIAFIKKGYINFEKLERFLASNKEMVDEMLLGGQEELLAKKKAEREEKHRMLEEKRAAVAQRKAERERARIEKEEAKKKLDEIKKKFISEFKGFEGAKSVTRLLGGDVVVGYDFSGNTEVMVYLEKDGTIYVETAFGDVDKFNINQIPAIKQKIKQYIKKYVK